MATRRKFLGGALLAPAAALLAPVAARADNGWHNFDVSGSSPSLQFDLVSASDGKPVTQADFKGDVVLLYFGYTYCPDVCPTELQTMSAAIAKLGPLAAQIVPIFISVDPERDTPEAIGSYVKLFDSRLVGLTGSTQQIADAARAYRVYYAKVTQTGGSGYLMDHSSLVYLMDPSGRFVALYNPQTDVDDMATELRNHLSQ